MKKFITIIGISIMTCVFIMTGCAATNGNKTPVLDNIKASNDTDTFNEEQSNELNKLKDKNASLMLQIKELEKKLWYPSNITYTTTEYSKRLVLDQCPFHVYPGEDAPLVSNEIIPGTLVKVLDAGYSESENRELWLYVIIPVYDTPMDYKGWIKESQTVPYNDENKGYLRNGIIIQNGAPIYNSYEDISLNKSEILEYENHGMITKELDGYVNISCPGGVAFWMENQYIVYPDIDN